MLNRNPSARTAAQQSTKCSLLFRHAQFLAILMLAAGLLSCNEESQTVENVDVEKRYTSYSCEIKVIDIDSCQYIVAQTGFSNGALSVVHKQNCKYCLNRKKIK
jgi:hypothetical protein